MSYNNQLPIVLQYFTNIAAVQNVGVLQLIWLCETMGVCYWCAKIPQCGNMEHGLKDIAFYVQNI